MLGVLLGGCEQFAALQAPPKQLTLSALNPADAEITEKVLLTRFGQFRPYVVSSISSKREGQRVTFVFERGSPGDDVLGYLVTTRGRFVASSSDGQVWVTGKDVVDALVSSGSDGENFLMIAFTDAAATRLKGLSSQRKGQILTVMLDDDALAMHRVAETLGHRISIPVRKDLRELELVATIVRSGELPVGVTVMEKTP